MSEEVTEPRWSAVNSAWCKAIDSNVSELTRRCPFSSTSMECARRKAAMVKVHLKQQELKLSGIVRTPNVLMLLLLMAVRGGPFFKERVLCSRGAKY